MATVQENIDTLTAAWLSEGRELPILKPLETAELIEFAKRNGISAVELRDVMRVLVDDKYRRELAGFEPAPNIRRS